MHSIMVIGGGLIALCVLTVIAWWIGKGQSGTMVKGAKIFVGAWFIVAAINMAVGVLHAGFTVAQEIPFFVLVFGVPALIAGGLIWYFKRR